MPDKSLAWGVWIKHVGWLKLDGDKARTFAATNIEYAQSAARLWGRGSMVLPIDGSLIDFEKTFLDRQKGWRLWMTSPKT